MKFKKLHYISTLLAAGIITLTMMSNSGGISGQSTAGCTNGGSCHAVSANVATVVGITGMPSQYVQGTTYPLVVTVTNASQTGATARAGFDLSVNVGSLATSGTGTQLFSTTEMGHNTPKNLVSGSTSWTFNWTAPSTGTTTAVFHLACNAANGNSTNDAGDIWNVGTFNLTAAPAASAPTVVTGGSSAVTNTTATVSGTITANGASTTALLEYGTTIAYGSPGTVTPGTVTGTTATPVSAPLTGLAPNTLYHYRYKGTNSVATTNGADATFTTLPNAPTIVIGTPSGITSTAATINATVNANGVSSAVTIEYGLTTSYGTPGTITPTPVTGTTPTAVTSNLSGLAPSTTYHYRINSTNTGGTTNSPDATFTTLAAVAAPTIVVGVPSAITFNSATINGTVNANNANATVTVEYGTTTGYGLIGNVPASPVSGVTPVAVTSALSGLTGSTTYHYRIVAQNSAGTTNSPDNTFTTAAAPALPTIVTGAPTGITSSAAVLHGTVNANNASTTVSIEYGTTVAYGTPAVVSPSTVTGSTATAISSNLSGLLPLTTYHYRINATNSVGTVNGPDATFTTLTNVSVPTVGVNTPTAITSTSATINGAVNANNATTTITVQYGTTTAYGSVGTSVPGTATGNTNTLMSSALSGLTPSTLYHYRIVAQNSAGVTNSPDNTFTTLTPPGLPVITLGTPGGITSIGATINGTVVATNATTAVSVEYGLTTAYGSSINTVPASVTGLAVTPVAGTLSLLSPSTVYHYRIKATNSIGTVYSADDVFTTDNPFNLPTIVLGTPSNLSYNRGVVNATVNANNSNTAVSVEYGLTTSYGSAINTAPAQVVGTTVTPVLGTISQLQPNTLYHYRVKATNNAGSAYSADDVFTTTQGVSVANIEAAGFHLYPNPGYDQLVLTTKENTTVTIQGTSMDGKSISLPYRKIAADQYQIDIAHLPQGMYLMVLKSEGQSFTTRFSKM